MTRTHTPHHEDSAARVLDDVRQFLQDERSMFGDILIIQAPDRPAKEAMPKETVAKPEVPEPFNQSGPAASEPWMSAESLPELQTQICQCMKCPLGESRTRFVFGVGNPEASLLIIGEAPGADEDKQGEPFVGRAGQLLNKILEAIEFKREDVFICNILKCRPPNNRAPLAEEVDLCIPYLKKQISLVRPKVILCLGLVAAGHLLGTKESLTRLRGKVHSYEQTPVMVTYHPAALLRNPHWKRPAWEDVQAVRKLHDELVAQSRVKE